MGWLQRMLLGDEASRMNGGDSLSSAGGEAWQKQSGEYVTAPTVPQEQVVQQVNAGETRPDLAHDTNGRKIIPEVAIENVESHVSSDMEHLELWVRLSNNSPLAVEVTQVNVLGSHVQFRRHLNAGESHEEKVYSGKTPHNDRYHTCEVQYKLVETGDYFQANHEIRYHYDRDERGEWHVPDEMTLIRPIRDI